MSPPRKEKVLVVGSVSSSLKALAAKLNTLNTSKSGPFDACFCTGPFFSSNDDEVNALLDGTTVFPIPVYFQDIGVPTKAVGKVLEDATNPYNPPPPNGIIRIGECPPSLPPSSSLLPPPPPPIPYLPPPSLLRSKQRPLPRLQVRPHHCEQTRRELDCPSGHLSRDRDRS